MPTPKKSTRRAPARKAAKPTIRAVHRRELKRAIAEQRQIERLARELPRRIQRANGAIAEFMHTQARALDIRLVHREELANRQKADDALGDQQRALLARIAELERDLSAAMMALEAALPSGVLCDEPAAAAAEAL